MDLPIDMALFDRVALLGRVGAAGGFLRAEGRALVLLALGADADVDGSLVFGN
jgi:hypothetical protein